MPSRLKIACLLTLPLLATACGDSLSDRNAAVGADEYYERVASNSASDDANPNPRIIDGSNARRNADEEVDEEDRPIGFADDEEMDDEDDPVTVDAAPEDLIVGTDGFAPEPVDDARGFAPEPFDPSPTAPTAPPPPSVPQ